MLLISQATTPIQYIKRKVTPSVPIPLCLPWHGPTPTIKDNSNKYLALRSFPSRRHQWQRWYLIYSNARQDFGLKFGKQICQVVLNSCMKHSTGPQQTRSLWTITCGAKPRTVLPNHVWSALFSDTIQHRVVIPYWHFRTTYWSPTTKARNTKGRKQHDASYLTQSSYFRSLSIIKFLKDMQCCGSRPHFHFQAKTHLTW